MYEQMHGRSRGTILRDLAILQIKLFLDGVKGAFLSQAAIAAAVCAMFVGPVGRGRTFYRILAMGEKFDLWLNLYGAARRADAGDDDLFSASRAGDDTLLGEIEELVRGEERGHAHPPVSSAARLRGR